MTDDKQEQFDPGFRIVDKRQAGKADESSDEAAAAAEETREASEAEQVQGPTETPQAERAEEPPQDAAAAAAEAEAKAAREAPPTEEPGAQFEPIDAYGLVQFCISLLRDFAWQRMGLVPDQVTKKMERDLAQARMAIDCVEALVQQMEASVSEAQGREFRRILNDLQINFVHQSSRES